MQNLPIGVAMNGEQDCPKRQWAKSRNFTVKSMHINISSHEIEDLVLINLA
jgi:hypothetical protein